MGTCSEYGLPPATVQNNLVANLVCIAGGAIIAVIMSNYFGRLPIILIWHIIALASGIWNATPPSFSSYVASRAVNGVFSIVAGAAGLMWIKDVFFFHEHPRMINLWSGGIVVVSEVEMKTSGKISAIQRLCVSELRAIILRGAIVGEAAMVFLIPLTSLISEMRISF